MEVYHCHLDELPEEKLPYLLELMAVQIELERRKAEAIEKAKSR